MVALLFIVVNGHLAIIATLVESFQAFPVGPEPLAFVYRMQAHAWGVEIFMLGLWIGLPLIGMLLFVNIVLGVIARVAPQINVFAVGFPVTLGVGLLGHAAHAADDAGALHAGVGADGGEFSLATTRCERWG